ncbi:MAG: hypothetical protein R3F61_32175 [Myxococcota bacterium]
MTLLLVLACSTTPSRNFRAELLDRYGEPPAPRTDPTPADPALAALTEGCAAKDAASCKHLALAQRDASEPVWSETLWRACELGSGEACSHLAFARLEGKEVPKDPRGALDAWIRGCKAGYDKSCFEAGVAFEEGDAGAADPSRAANLFGKSCLMGFSPACQYLSRFHVQGLGVDPDPEMAGWLACHECELQHQGARPDAGYAPGSAPVCKGLSALKTLGVSAASAEACPVGPP